MIISLKSRAGITRGCGLTESIRVLWASTAHRCGAIHEAMTNLIGNKRKSSKQLLEINQGRKTHDNTGLSTFISLFQTHNPFNRDVQEHWSLLSGLTVSTAENLSFDNCEYPGETIQLDRVSIVQYSIKRNDQVNSSKFISIY